jgi:ribosomal subunit interface protein
MKINIRAVHFEMTNDVRDYAAEKIGKLDTFYKNIVLAEVAIENHESESKEQHHYSAKVNLSVPGKDIFAEGTGADEFTALDNVEQKLRVQIEKLKGRQNRGKIDEFSRLVRRWFGKE